MEIIFVCPDCGRSKLEAVQSGCVIVTPLRFFCDELVWCSDDMEILEGSVDRVQCRNCGWVVPLEDPNDEEELLKWVSNQKYIIKE